MQQVLARVASATQESPTPNGFDLFHVWLGMLLPPFLGLQRRGVQGYRAVVEIGVLRSASVYYSTPKINVPAAENGDPSLCRPTVGKRAATF